MVTLTTKQKKYLQDHIEAFWEVFVEADPDLPTSTCPCCKDKRSLVAHVLSVTDTDQEAIVACASVAYDEVDKTCSGQILSSAVLLAGAVAAEQAISKLTFCRPGRKKLPNLAIRTKTHSSSEHKVIIIDTYDPKKDENDATVFLIKVDPREI